MLFDVSRSTDDPDVRAGYLATFERVLDHAVAEHGTVVGDVIDENPLAHSTYPIDATFSACDPLTDNRLKCDAEAGEERAAALAAARALLERDGGRAGTDIHDGLALAERVFAAYPEAAERSLVVLSDMVERSARLNLGRPGFGEDAIDAELDALDADALIPDLTGVRVYVVGAGVQQASGLDAERFLAIQRFWQAFAERAGATLPDERYGAALVRFP
ncbi:MAG: hypothetical protein U0V56_11885 [Actinomycetota bacterium]